MAKRNVSNSTSYFEYDSFITHQKITYSLIAIKINLLELQQICRNHATDFIKAPLEIIAMRSLNRAEQNKCVAWKWEIYLYTYSSTTAQNGVGKNKPLKPGQSGNV